MKSPAPAFQFYPQDFLVGTADMTAQEVGGYIRLLCYQWAKGCLPKDESKLMHLSGISDGLSMGNVSVKFRLCEDGNLRNDRLEKIRLLQEEYRQKQAENGKKGGNPNFKTGKHNPYYNRPLSSGDNPKDNLGDNPKINSSSSSSSSINKEEEAANAAIALNTKKSFKPPSKFVHQWCKEYRSFFNKEYLVIDVKDEMGSGALTGLREVTQEQVLEIAKKAWALDKFYCKHALTLHGFAKHFNQIRGEVGELKTGSTFNLRPSL